MILASHQPNFLPYLNYFKKMYLCDVFTISNTVRYSRSDGYHNFNFFNFNGRRGKILIPVKKHSGPINEVKIAENFKPRKLLRTLEQYYSKHPYFEEVYKDIEQIINKNHEYLWELNLDLILLVHRKMNLKCRIVLESDLYLPDEPNIAIVYMAKRFYCKTYLSGLGGKNYIYEDIFKDNEIKLQYLTITDVNYGSAIPNLSILDYLMYRGYTVPQEWKE